MRREWRKWRAPFPVGGPCLPGGQAGPSPAHPRLLAAEVRLAVIVRARHSNRLAMHSAEIVVRNPGQFTPLFLYGPTSVGKTHLLEGIWSAARKAGAATTVYLSAEQFTSHFLEALRSGGLPAFRRKYRGVNVLISTTCNSWRASGRRRWR